MTPKAERAPHAEKPLAMRRRPRQARAQSTLDCIKQAASQLIDKQGLPACRTEAVAARAGVSIGTLYKYFPNREAILKALYEDASLAHAQRVGTLTLQILDLPTERGMTLTLRNVVPLHRDNWLLLFRLVEECPELHLHEQPLSFHKLVHNHMRAYVQHRNPRLKPDEVRKRVFFVERTVFGCIEGYLRWDDPVMSFDGFTRDLARLIADIIDRPAPARTRKVVAGGA